MDPSIRQFIDTQFDALDYSKRIDHKRLNTSGAVFDLQKLYDKINRQYFQDELDLSITWYGKIHGRPRNQFNFGLYYYPLKLVKIHCVLDHLIVPQYLVEYVIYHEMLHHVCRPYYDEKGIYRVHSKLFKQREKQFLHYKLATDWLKKHRELFFNGEMG
jgi:hypothetical protein